MSGKTTFPRIPESNWWAIRRQFADKLPAAVTPGYLMALLGLASAKAARNLLPPLKQLGLIDKDGVPTLRAKDWRSDAKYDEVCQQMVKEVYPAELRDLFSGPSIDREGCTRWFMHTAGLGRKTAAKVAATYVLLNTPLHQVSSLDVKTKREVLRRNVTRKDKDLREVLARLPGVQGGGARLPRSTCTLQALVEDPDLQRVVLKLFMDGHYTRAVEEAFKFLNNLVKRRAGLPEDGAPLMRRAFSLNSPILTLNSGRSRSEQDEQQGHMEILAGCMTGIRNPRAHEHDWVDNEKRALQLLAFADYLVQRVKSAKISPARLDNICRTDEEGGPLHGLLST